MSCLRKFDLVVSGGRVFVEGALGKVDIGIKGEKIVAIGRRLQSSAAELIEATGKVVMPGIIDPHVHFQLPSGDFVSADDFTSGSIAAAYGGVTTFIDFAIQKKGQSLLEAIESRKKEADGRVAVDYSLHASPTEWSEHTLAEFYEAIKLGITSFKLYMTYKNKGLYSNDGALYAALEKSAQTGCLITLHAESADLIDLFTARYHNEAAMAKYGAYAHSLARPAIVEIEAVQRAALLAKETKGNLYFVHLSCGKSIDIIRRARGDGLSIYAETCPHYLIFTDDIFKNQDGHLFATAPQVKKKTDRDALWKGIARGDISVIATDDCGFTIAQKSSWQNDFTRIPCGLPGVETMLPLIYTYGVRGGRISLGKMIKMLCLNPARLFGLYPRKGVIAIGSDADLVIFDPHKKTRITCRNLHSKCDWSPYEGKTVWGVPEITINRGKIIVKNGHYVGSPGEGKFLRRDLPKAPIA